LSWQDAPMRTALAVVAAIILALLGAILLIMMLNVTGLPLCGDRAALRTADECIEASSGERVIGLIAGWLATVCAALGFAFAIRLAARGSGATRLAVTGALAPVLALLAVAFLPVSF
jgi:hypothetical protein